METKGPRRDSPPTPQRACVIAQQYSPASPRFKFLTFLSSTSLKLHNIKLR